MTREHTPRRRCRISACCAPLQVRPIVPFQRERDITSFPNDALDALNLYHERATYGAVAGLLGVPPLSVMRGRPRDWRHSWVVNAETGWPTE